MSFYIDSEGRLSENKIPNYTIKIRRKLVIINVS